MTRAYNMDCMEALRQTPDKFYDLAVVDPPYGGGSQSVHVERERERAELHGGAADFEHRKRSRFGGVFDRYHIGNADGRGMVQQMHDPHWGYL